jgi:hypothetical protein
MGWVSLLDGKDYSRLYTDLWWRNVSDNGHFGNGEVVRSELPPERD